MLNLPVNSGSQKRRLLAALLLAVAAFAQATTFVVVNVNDSGIGSLRQAITDANNNPGPDTILFTIIGTPPLVINLTSGLPAIAETLSLDGTSQLGFSNKPLVVLNGAALGGSVNGLTLNSGGNTIRGLVIKSFSAYGIEALAATGGTNTIQGCFIGTDLNGTIAQSNLLGGIHLGASSDNLIGGTNALDGNLISGNNNDGVWIEGKPGSARNQIVGNWIGTAWGGMAALGNAQQGVRISAAQFNVVGGSTPGARNVISGNGQSGMAVEGSTATNNMILGNYIGLNNAGLSSLPNGQYGVRLTSGARFNTVGGTNAGNVISGNTRSGVDLSVGAQNNLIQGNFIGTSKWGTNAVPNGQVGVTLSSTTNNLVGGTVPGVRNVISGNANDGIALSDGGARSNRIEGNFIGIDATGTNTLGNGRAGVWVTNAPANVIGSSVAGGGNVISGNATHGVYLHSAGASANKLYGNLIGTDATGTKGLGNGAAYFGITVENAPGNIIGGLLATERNVISSNNTGIYISGTGASNNVIQGNYIGSDVTGMNPVGNKKEGIVIGYDLTPAEIPRNNVIGGSAPGAGNVIVANGTPKIDGIDSYRPGVFIDNSVGTIIQGNLIGVKADGVSPLGNIGHNIELKIATNTIIGGLAPNTWNVVANSVTPGRSGIRLRSGAGNAIMGNSIYGNGLMGISFNGNSPTLNDGSCDSDAGVNGLQNFPVLTNAVSDGFTTVVKGYLPSTAGQSYQLQFYASPTANPAGLWEGRKFLGTTTLTLGAACTNSFVAKLPNATPAGWRITATATDAGNNTSEFSAVAILPGNAPNLGLQPSVDGSISISWLLTNTFGGSWQLMQTTNLTPPIVWADVADMPTVISNGTWFTVTVGTTNSTRFFRLLYQ